MKDELNLIELAKKYSGEDKAREFMESLDTLTALLKTPPPTKGGKP